MIEKHRKLVLWILASLALICIALLPLRLQEIRSADWPTVEGVITRSALFHGRLKGVDAYRAELAYGYEVGGRAFEGTQLDFHYSQHAYTLENAENLRREYPPGKKIKVHYDPSSPGFAVLEPGLSDEGRILWVLNLSLIAAFALALAGVVVEGRFAARRKR